MAGDTPGDESIFQLNALGGPKGQGGGSTSMHRRVMCVRDCPALGGRPLHLLHGCKRREEVSLYDKAVEV